MNTTHPEHTLKLGAFSPAMEAMSLRIPEPFDWLHDIGESCNRKPLEFAWSWEEEFVVMLDKYQVSWQYKPRTFAVEWDEEGNFVDCFTPGFYLPAFDLYVEVAATDYRAAGEKARKVHLLRQEHPEIRIEFRSADRLAQLLGIFF
jgi:hypothetical protein